MLWESRAWAAPLPSQFCTGTRSLPCTLLLGGRANGLWGSVVPQSLSSGRKMSFLHWRAGLWELQLIGIQLQQQLYPYGADTEAALPTVELPAKLQTCRTSPWLSAKSSQCLAGGSEVSPGLTLLRGE